MAVSGTEKRWDDSIFQVESLEVDSTDTALDLTGVSPGTNTDGSLLKAGTFGSRISYSTASQYGMAIYQDNTATSGTFRAIRLRTGSNAASGANSIDNFLCQVSAESGKNATTLNSGFFELIPKGTNTITTGRVLLCNADSAAAQTMTTQIIGHFRVHTRGDETITNDEMIRLENEAVGGNGRQLDSYIRFTETNMSGGIKSAAYLLDAGTSTSLLATAVMRLPDDEVTAWDAATGSGDTEAGAIKVVIGSAVRYIQLYSDAPA